MLSPTSVDRSEEQRQIVASRQRALAIFLLLIASGWTLNRSALWWSSLGQPTVTQPHFEADLNHAPSYELQLLPGVGPKTIQEIESYRASHGLFEKAEDLDNVRGFGKAKVEQLRDHLGGVQK